MAAAGGALLAASAAHFVALIVLLVGVGHASAQQASPSADDMQKIMAKAQSGQKLTPEEIKQLQEWAQSMAGGMKGQKSSAAGPAGAKSAGAAPQDAASGGGARSSGGRDPGGPRGASALAADDDKNSWLLTLDCSYEFSRSRSSSNALESHTEKREDRYTLHVVGLVKESGVWSRTLRFDKDPLEALEGSHSDSMDIHDTGPYYWHELSVQGTAHVVTNDGHVVVHVDLRTPGEQGLSIWAKYSGTSDTKDDEHYDFHPERSHSYHSIDPGGGSHGWHVSPRDGTVRHDSSGNWTYRFDSTTTETFPGYLAGTDTTTVHVTGTLRLPPPNDGYITVLEPKPGSFKPGIEDYREKWRPRAGNDMNTAGSMVGFKVAERKRGTVDTPPKAPRKFRVRFELFDVSSEPGLCLNWPPKGEKGNDALDLKFDQRFNRDYNIEEKEAGFIATSKTPRAVQVAYVSVYDWGAYGKIRATLLYDDEIGKSEEPAHVAYLPDRGHIRIPYDENDNHIADNWEKDAKNPGGDDPKSDVDAEPKNEDHLDGDGLSFYEEYRGFRIQGRHHRTFPNLKDVFIYSKTLGTGYFTESGLAVWVILDKEELFFDPKEKPNGRVINPNRKTASAGEQHALWLAGVVDKGKDPGAKYTHGETNDAELGHTWDSLGPPVHVDVVAIYLRNHGPKDDVSNTIAHELGHGCALRHHGCKDYSTRGPIESYLETHPPVWVVLDPAIEGLDKGVSVRVNHGNTSGDASCVMRYESGFLMEMGREGLSGILRWPKGSGFGYGWFFKWGPPGTTFCSSQEGTGVNVPPGSQAGDAKFGKCKNHFDVNDRHAATSVRCED